jgi:hypothetical protein
LLHVIESECSVQHEPTLLTMNGTHPAPSNQFFKLAAATPSRGRSCAFKRASTLPVHPGTVVASSGSISSLNRSAILSVQVVSAPLLCNVSTRLIGMSGAVRGLGSTSRNSTTPSG